jgi:hypothetical protein
MGMQEVYFAKTPTVTPAAIPTAIPLKLFQNALRFAVFRSLLRISIKSLDTFN